AYVELPPLVLPDGSKKRRRAHAQGESIAAAVARLILQLRQKDFQMEADALLDSALSVLGAGFQDLLTDAQPHTTPLLGEALAAHIEARHRDGKIGDETHQRYAGLLKNHIAPHPIAKKHLDEVSRQDVEGFLDDLAAKRNEHGKPQLGTSPRRTIHDLLSQIFVKATRDEVIAKNPMLTVERAKKKHKAPGAQFAQKPGASRMLSRIFQTMPYEDYLRQLLLCLGMRTSERLGLQYQRLVWSKADDADALHGRLSFPALHIHVSHQLDRSVERHLIPLKTEESPRVLPMPLLALPHVDALLLRRAIEIVRLAQTRRNKQDKRLLAALRKHPQRLKDEGFTYDSNGAVLSPVFDETTFLFTNASGIPHRQQRANVLWRKTLDDLGVQEHIREQDLRHVAVSFLGEQRYSFPAIASITGHALRDTRSLSATYLHITEQTRAEEMELLAALYARPAEPVASDDIPAPLLSYAEQVPIYTLWRPPFLTDEALKQGASETDRQTRGSLQRYLPASLRTVSLADDSVTGAHEALTALSAQVIALADMRGYYVSGAPSTPPPATVEQAQEEVESATVSPVASGREPTRNERERALLDRIHYVSEDETAEINANRPAISDEQAQEMAARLRADLRAAKRAREHGSEADNGHNDEPAEVEETPDEATARLASRLLKDLEQDLEKEE
ncbi:hypothetical protein EFN19_02390, partial [Propionibacterium freudenreichii]|nr:hypothetical protein [Propionibacterium freudenreichii]